MFFNGFIKIIGAQNQLLNTFCSELVCNKTLKARISTHTHTHEYPTFNITKVVFLFYKFFEKGVL